MSRGPIQVTREPLSQPEISSTTKAQKRYRQGPSYDPTAINAELDFVHERINGIVDVGAALSDLDPAATLPEAVARINELTEILRMAGIIKPS